MCDTLHGQIADIQLAASDQSLVVGWRGTRARWWGGGEPELGGGGGGGQLSPEMRSKRAKGCFCSIIHVGGSNQRDRRKI